MARPGQEPCWLEQTESLNSGAVAESKRGRPLVQTERPHLLAWPLQTDSSEKPTKAGQKVLSTARRPQRGRLGLLGASPERNCVCLRSMRTISPRVVPPCVGPVGRLAPEIVPDKLGKFQIPVRLADRCVAHFPKEQVATSVAAQEIQCPRARVRVAAGELHRRRLVACWWVPQRPCQTGKDRWGH